MVIVVEGKNDYSKLKSIFQDADIVITNGSDVTEELLVMLEELSTRQEIILCLDPDYPGMRIRSIISNRIKNVHHVYAEKEKAISKNKRKVGIEHMSREDIIDLFSEIKFQKTGSDISLSDLVDLKLIGGTDSKQRRIKVCQKLKIGYCNSKQLINRLHMFGITFMELKEAYDC